MRGGPAHDRIQRLRNDGSMTNDGERTRFRQGRGPGPTGPSGQRAGFGTGTFPGSRAASYVDTSYFEGGFDTGFPASFHAPMPPSRFTRLVNPRVSILAHARALRPPAAQCTR